MFDSFFFFLFLLLLDFFGLIKRDNSSFAKACALQASLAEMWCRRSYKRKRSRRTQRSLNAERPLTLQTVGAL